jgi:chemotaxis protein methyltransferase CheR
MAPADAALALSDSEYRMFRDLFKRVCGLWFGEDARLLLEKRLARRVRQLELPSFAAYHYLLRKELTAEEEIAAVIDELTTNETYFFRERNQLRALIEEIVPELIARRGGPVNVWSAGCSSGEEPYSIVMMALDAGLRPGIDLRVHASDISRRCLARAREGQYRPASFRETPPATRARYFSEKDGLSTLTPDVRRHVLFTRMNLLEPARFALLGALDVVLCRNVIIYFDRDTKRQVIESFSERLGPGGYLLLGHSESLIHVTSAFELAHLRNDLVYKKPAREAEAVDPRHVAAFSALRRAGRERGTR